MTTALQPLVDAAAFNGQITLIEGEYDDANPVYITKNIEIQGPRTAKVHTEFVICNGAAVRFNGFTLEMNKAGAPAFTGDIIPYPQNASVMVINSSLWSDDVEFRTTGTFGKGAIEAMNGFVNLRSVNIFSRIDWRNSTDPLMKLLYGSVCNAFGQDSSNLAFNFISGSTTRAIDIINSDFMMSGSHLSNFGTGPIGLNLQRDSFVHIGVGLPSTLIGFSTPTNLTDTSRKFIGVTGSSG